MRYIPATEQDREIMLKKIGVDSTDKLFDSIPEKLKLNRKFNLPAAMDEEAVTREIGRLSGKSDPLPSFMGAGIYDCFQPAVVRSVLRLGNFFTAYTPYQPEVSQGTLQNIFEFQTLICELTGLDAANASMYDGASAAAEAVSMALNATRRRKVVLSGNINPLYRQVIRTYLSGREIDIAETPCCTKESVGTGKTETSDLTAAMDSDIACVVVQCPNFYGNIEDMKTLREAVRKVDQKTLFISIVDPTSLALLSSPGEYDADIAVGEGQSLGLSSSFGGPGLGFFAVKSKLARQIPGRIVGLSTDTEGRRSFVLTMQTREQHIRRERASSNICSNQALCALGNAVYMTALGWEGMVEVAEGCLSRAIYAEKALLSIPGIIRMHKAPYFREFAVMLPGKAASLQDYLLKNGIIGGLDMARWTENERVMLFAFTERRTKDEIDRLVKLTANWAALQAERGER